MAACGFFKRARKVAAATSVYSREQALEHYCTMLNLAALKP